MNTVAVLDLVLALCAVAGAAVFAASRLVSSSRPPPCCAPPQRATDAPLVQIGRRRR